MSWNGTNTNGTYMDYMEGVRVKISEKCRAVAPISVPSGLFERVSSLGESARGLEYDFALETGVLKKLDEWRRAKEAAKADRGHRLRLKEEARQRELDRIEGERRLQRLRLHDVTYPNADEIEIDRQEDILRPTPVLNGNPVRMDLLDDLDSIRRYQRSVKIKPANGDVDRLTFSDFENDTSSPFDNLELKTINDIELLAQVLNPRPYHYRLPPDPPVPPLYGYEAYAPPPLNNHCDSSLLAVGNAANVPDYKERLKWGDEGGAAVGARSRSVPDIVKELDDEIRGARLKSKSKERSHNCSPAPRNLSESGAPKPPPPERLPNPYDGLAPRLQAVCKYINGMGFPLDRVARACQNIGEDDKKIIEYLLNMGQLMDFGFAEKPVADALLKHDCNKDKALDDLIS